MSQVSRHPIVAQDVVHVRMALAEVGISPLQVWLANGKLQTYPGDERLLRAVWKALNLLRKEWVYPCWACTKDYHDRWRRGPSTPEPQCRAVEPMTEDCGATWR